MAKLTKKQQREVSILIACIKSASRTQAARLRIMQAAGPDTYEAALQAYIAIAAEARLFENRILDICAGGAG